MAALAFWIRIAYRLTAVLAGLCAIVLGLARAHKVPEDPYGVPFAVCEGIPCVMGVSPGVTVWSDAQQRLSSVPDSQVFAREIVLLIDQATTAAFYPSVNRKAVGRIYVDFSNDRSPSVGWIVERYGTPCGVSVYFQTGLLTLRYSTLLANVRLVGGLLTVSAPISSIHFADPDFRSAIQPDLCVDNVSSGGMINRPWYGFSSVRFYRDHPAGG